MTSVIQNRCKFFRLMPSEPVMAGAREGKTKHRSNRAQPPGISFHNVLSQQFLKQKRVWKDIEGVLTLTSYQKDSKFKKMKNEFTCSFIDV